MLLCGTVLLEWMTKHKGQGKSPPLFNTWLHIVSRRGRGGRAEVLASAFFISHLQQELSTGVHVSQLQSCALTANERCDGTPCKKKRIIAGKSAIHCQLELALN